MNITIRRAQPAETNALTVLIMRSKRSNGYDEAFMDACHDVLAVTPERLAKGEYWVAEAGTLCGCASLWPDSDGISAEVNAFFIAPEWQGKGVGRLLWQKLVERATALGFHNLHLDSDPAAVPFYLAMGFTVTGQSPSEAIPGRVLPYMAISLTDRL